MKSNYIMIKALTEMEFSYKKISGNQAAWYGSKKECYLVRFKGHAPLDKIASVVNGRYASNAATGYINGNGVLGSCSVLMEKIDVLLSLGYIAKEITEYED